MLESSFLITIGVLFVVAMVGAWLRARRRDRCLRDFEDYNVTLEQGDGALARGVMELAPNGIELHYQQSIRGVRHLESSFILYRDELTSLQALYRYADELTEDNAARRAKQVARAFHPGPTRAAIRKLRNFISIAAESLNEAVGLLLGRVRRPGSRLFSDANQGYLKKLGGEMIGHVGGAHDHMMERLIGTKVVAEIIEDEAVHEHVAVFKEYSAQFVELLDIAFPQKRSIAVTSTQPTHDKQIGVDLDDGALVVRNSGERSAIVDKLVSEAGEQLFGLEVAPRLRVSRFRWRSRCPRRRSRFGWCAIWT